MPTQKKLDTVEELRACIERAAITIAAEYRGLSVGEITALRRAVRDAGLDLKVVKNRLFLRAAEAAGHPEFAALLDGPTAIVFGYDDVVAPAKTVADYMRTARNSFAVRNGVMGGQMLSLAEIQDLATLPSRSVLLGQLAGALQAPVTRLAWLLNGTMQTFAGLLNSRANQLEEA
jgi:large subunit ribosomal protein L10